MKKTPKGNYEVGYAKPPVPSQFGQRPQPARRSKKRSAPIHDLRSVLLEEVVLKVDGKARRVPYSEAFLQTVKHKALQGDVRAAKIIIELMKALGMISAKPATELVPPIINVHYGNTAASDDDDA